MAEEHEHSYRFRGIVSWGGQRYKLFVCDDLTCKQELTLPAGDDAED